MDRTDVDIIASCLNGQPDDYRYLIGRYERVVLARLTGRLGNAAGAEEAAQETFVRAYFALAKLRKRESFFPWLLGMADRVAKEQIRARRRDRLLVKASAEKLAGKAGEKRTDTDVDLQRAIAALPDSQQQVISLRYYAGLSCKQVAEKLHMPIGTVTKTLSRGHAALRKLLARPGERERQNREVHS